MSETKSMNWLEVTVRYCFAAQLIFWGLNGFFFWVKTPPSDPRIQDFTDACIRTKFIMPTVKILEIATGVLLLSGLWTSLALIVLSPLMFIITGLHVLYNPRPWGVLLPISGLYGLLLLIHAKSLFSIFLS